MYGLPMSWVAYRDSFLSSSYPVPQAWETVWALHLPAVQQAQRGEGAGLKPQSLCVAEHSHKAGACHVIMKACVLTRCLKAGELFSGPHPHQHVHSPEP